MQFLSALALVETVAWLWIIVTAVGLVVYENLKRQYGITSSSKMILHSAGIVGKNILYEEVLQFEKKHPLIVILYDFLC